MQRLLILLLSLGCVAISPAAAPEGSIDDFIESEISASGVPGLSYAVVKDGEIVSSSAYGVLRFGSDEQITADTAFLIGSITKSITALGVMQLVEAGDIDLDAEVSRYLGEFAGMPAGAITIRELLSHTSGFSTLQGNTSHTDVTGGRDELERRVTQLAQVTPEHPPGERWEYSNTNYQILGRVIEVVSGREFQAYVGTNILEPIGMADSFVADGAVHDSMATGHRPWFGAKLPLPENSTERGTAPQGGLIASASDLARYLATMMNGADDVLSAQGKTLMMTPASDVSPFYGFGWFVDTSTGLVSHGGTSPGFESLATMMPAQNKAVVVLVNGGSGLGFGETAALLDGVTARALNLDEADQSPLSRQALFLGLVLLPIGYLLAMVWAWLRRTKVRAKTRSGVPGLFSLWFPLLTTLVAAWVIIELVPTLIGSPIGNLLLFQPDVGLVFVASAVTGVLWAGFRLGIAYSGRSTSKGSLASGAIVVPPSASPDRDLKRPDAPPQ